MYTFAANEEILVTAAIVDAGPTGTTFLTVADRRTGHLLADISRPGGTRPMVSVNAHPGEGTAAATACPDRIVSMKTVDGILSVRAKIGSPVGLPAIGAPAVELDLHFDITAQPPLTVISDLDTDPPAVSTTGKNAALPVNGRVVIRHAGLLHAFDFADAVGGFDYTSGFLPATPSGDGRTSQAIWPTIACSGSTSPLISRVCRPAPGRTPWVGRNAARHRPRRADQLRPGGAGEGVAHHDL